MENWKHIIVVSLIFFVGMCGVIAVDRECQFTTGEGGKIGLSLTRSEEGHVQVGVFGIEGELP